MFARQNHRLDFADTRAGGAESVFALPAASRYEGVDAFDQLASADDADRTLLRMVLCAAAATLTLALATSLGN
jgi:hypothetical protein